MLAILKSVMFTSDKQRGIAIVLCHSWPCCYQEQVYREVTDALAPDLAKGYISIEGWKLYTPVSWNVRDCQTCSCGALAKEMDGKKQKKTSFSCCRRAVAAILSNHLSSLPTKRDSLAGESYSSWLRGYPALRARDWRRPDEENLHAWPSSASGLTGHKIMYVDFQQEHWDRIRTSNSIERIAAKSGGARGWSTPSRAACRPPVRKCARNLTVPRCAERYEHSVARND